MGKFFYFVNNLHIYDNQFEQARELLSRESTDCKPRLVLNVPDGTDFFDIKPEDLRIDTYVQVVPEDNILIKRIQPFELPYSNGNKLLHVKVNVVKFKIENKR